MELIKMIEFAMRGNDAAIIAKAEDATKKAFNFVKEHDAAEYDCIIRDLHEAIYGPHYDEDFAEKDVANLYYTDSAGTKHNGPHWTKAQVMEATKKFEFPKDTTECDKYVAFNAAYADFCKDFTEEQVLTIGYRFFFADEDWKSKGKIWTYMRMNK